MPDDLRGYDRYVTLVCIDTYENNVPSGRFYNSYLEKWFSFDNFIQFVLKMEACLDETKLPQSFVQPRSFSAVNRSWPERPPDGGMRQGKLATLSVRILYRQNSSWQGTITWLEGKEEQAFRSLNEFIVLLDSAVERNGQEVS